MDTLTNGNLSVHQFAYYLREIPFERKMIHLMSMIAFFLSLHLWERSPLPIWEVLTIAEFLSPFDICWTRAACFPLPTRPQPRSRCRSRRRRKWRQQRKPRHEGWEAETCCQMGTTIYYISPESCPGCGGEVWGAVQGVVHYAGVVFSYIQYIHAQIHMNRYGSNNYHDELFFVVFVCVC